jgi:hypothetical protein
MTDEQWYQSQAQGRARKSVETSGKRERLPYKEMFRWQINVQIADQL